MKGCIAVAETGQAVMELPPRELRTEQPAGSLMRAATILRAVANGGRSGASLPDLVRRTGLPRPTIHRVCQMLQDIGWLERDGAGRRFFLGVELATFGLTAQLRHPLDELAGPVLSRLSGETAQTFYLIVRSGDDAVCVARHESVAQIRTLVLEVGSRQPLGIGAGSMAILAALPEDESDRVIAGNRERYFERPAFDEAAFRAALRAARETGLAGHDGLFTRGVSGIGVAVPDGSGHPLAALSTAFITQSLDAGQQRLCVARMQEGAEEIARRLTGQMPGRLPA